MKPRPLPYRLDDHITPDALEIFGEDDAIQTRPAAVLIHTQHGIWRHSGSVRILAGFGGVKHEATRGDPNREVTRSETVTGHAVELAPVLQEGWEDSPKRMTGRVARCARCGGSSSRPSERGMVSGKFLS
jgi:hypothetical protein